MKRRLSLTYHPEIDGVIKRANQVIQPYLHVYTTFSKDNQEDFLSITQLAINNRVVSHVTGYPARSRDRSCDRHTAQPLLAESRAGSCAGSCDESCARLCVGTVDHRNLPRALGSRALSAALGPLAPTATPSLLAYGHSFLVANTLRQPWPMAAFVSRRPSALGGLQPTAVSGP